MTSDAADEWSTSEEAELLRRYAPILQFDSRELFFPVSVEGFIESSSLLLEGTEILPAGTVNAESLGDHVNAGTYLQFVSDQDRLEVVSEEVKRLARKLFGPRLGRVGFFGRILDAFFQLSILVRPTTPRLTTVAAALKVERLGLQQKPVVYARVVEVGDWLVLHYSYFYVMNDWRSGYHGLNDHEGDWEQAWVFCDRADLEPVWIVASSHEYTGGDLRRHWNDPMCERINDRPVLYTGAGSHALYHRPGDYVTRVEIPGFSWLLRFQRWTRRMLRITDQAAERGLGPALGMPFVDAATGDGVVVEDWDIRRLNTERACFGTYRGLWGLDTGDPTGGERGPSGPKFTRNGEIRSSWADPVGFAEMHGTSPPSAQDSTARLDEIDLSLSELDSEINRLMRISQLRGQAATDEAAKNESERLTHLMRQRAELVDLRQQVDLGAESVVGYRDHLHHPAVSLAPPKESGWILAVWAASSVPLLLLAAATLALFGSLQVSNLLADSPFANLVGGLRIGGIIIALAAVASLLEQLARRNFQAAFRLLVIYAALASFVAFVSVISVSRYALGALLVLAGVVLFFANLGELTAVHRRAETTSRDKSGL